MWCLVLAWWTVAWRPEEQVDGDLGGPSPRTPQYSPEVVRCARIKGATAPGRQPDSLAVNDR